MMNTLKNGFFAICLGLIVFLFPFSGVGADTPRILKGHSSTVKSVVYSPNGDTLASACRSGDKTIKLWNAKTGKLIHTLSGHSDDINVIAYSPDGKILASASDDKTVKLWKVKTGVLKYTLTEHFPVKFLTYSPDGKTLASVSSSWRDDHEHTIKLWNAKTGELKYTFTNTIKLWKAKTGELKYTFTGHSKSVNAIAYSLDSKTLASASNDKTVKLWNVQTGELKHTFTGHSYSVENVKYSPDGTLLASASGDIKLWNAKTGELKHTLTEYLGFANAFVYSPDGEILAFASDNNTIKLWHTKTGKIKHSLVGHRNSANALAYSPTESILASVDDDRIKLWNTKTGKLIVNLQHSDSVNAISYSPDGQTLVSASSGDDVYIWDVSAKTLEQLMFAQLSELPEKIQELELVPTKLNQVKKELERLDSDLISQIPSQEDGLKMWFEELHRFEKAGDLRIRRLRGELPDFFDRDIGRIFFNRLRVGADMLEFENQVTDSYLPDLAKLHKRIANTPVLERIDIREELEVLEARLMSELSRFTLGIGRMKYYVSGDKGKPRQTMAAAKSSESRCWTKHCSAPISSPPVPPVLTKSSYGFGGSGGGSSGGSGGFGGSVGGSGGFGGAKSRTSQKGCWTKDCSAPISSPPVLTKPSSKFAHPRPEHQGQDIPITRKTQPLPHNGLFTRRNNAFGTKLNTGIEELIAQGVMIEQENIRFDDFIAMNTEGIPSPKAKNALAVSYGITSIPDYQKRDKRVTHYLEIALKTADVAPVGHPETQTPPVNYIFVVDVSGSMSGEKLDTVKVAIRELFTRLRADDVIGVVAFDDQAKTLLESTLKQNISPSDFGKIINQLNTGGSTDINLALSISIDEMRRYRGAQRVNQLFLFSDGNPTSGEIDWINIRQNIAAKLRQNTATDGNIRLSTFVFGTDANQVELDRLAGITGGQSTFVIEPKEDVRHGLQQELARRTHLAAINVQMQIEIAPEIDILHFYGHDLITDPATRAAIEREADLTGKKVEEDYGVKAQPDLIKEDKGIRVFVPNLAVGETYWVVFELAVPESHQATDFGKATIQYFDTFAHQNQKPQFALSPNGQIDPQWVAQHALGLWTSEIAYDALYDVKANDLKTAEKRIQNHISVLETVKTHLPPPMRAKSIIPVKLVDDIITLTKLLSLAKNINQGASANNARMYLNHGLGELNREGDGYVRVNYGRE